eukprot:c4309_g1_i1.p1 GENE.c4309_g1_i1~~c4309_g1_i1.p1  ORF type:complete len:415 (+),score=55.04 c4309_g1_i1:1735-2979(+)
MSKRFSVPRPPPANARQQQVGEGLTAQNLAKEEMVDEEFDIVTPRVPPLNAPSLFPNSTNSTSFQKVQNNTRPQQPIRSNSAIPMLSHNNASDFSPSFSVPSQGTNRRSSFRTDSEGSFWQLPSRAPHAGGHRSASAPLPSASSNSSFAPPMLKTGAPKKASRDSNGRRPLSGLFALPGVRLKASEPVLVTSGRASDETSPPSSSSSVSSGGDHPRLNDARIRKGWRGSVMGVLSDQRNASSSFSPPIDNRQSNPMLSSASFPIIAPTAHRPAPISRKSNEQIRRSSNNHISQPQNTRETFFDRQKIPSEFSPILENPPRRRPASLTTQRRHGYLCEMAPVSFPTDVRFDPVQLPNSGVAEQVLDDWTLITCGPDGNNPPTPLISQEIERRQPIPKRTYVQTPYVSVDAHRMGV